MCSRSTSSPVVWSIWASTITIAQMPVSRTARPGCSGGNDASCSRMSGDALNSTQSVPSALTVMDDCVRAVPCSVPSRSRRQLLQLQFHWGKPPPAPDPRT